MTRRGTKGAAGLTRRTIGHLAVSLVLGCGALSPAFAAKASSEAKPANAQLDKLANELRPLVKNTKSLPADATWAKTVDGQVLVKVLIVGASTDPDLVSLRADVVARGGSVHYNYISVRALAAMLPTTALAAIAERNDVLAISPNRATQRQTSLVQMVSGIGELTGTTSKTSTSSTLDGRGVGIAVLDSGIDFRHQNLQGADGKTRVRGAVDFVSLGRTIFSGGWTAGRDFSQTIKIADRCQPDLERHGHHGAFRHGA